MTKKHHPQTRAERLALKQRLDVKIKDKDTSKVWRKRTLEQIKSEETSNVLQQYTQLTDHPRYAD